MKQLLLILLACISITTTSAQEVIGGGYAKSGEYPWMVSLEVQGTQLCGAALIAPQWVLTAGHCGAGWPPFIPQPTGVRVSLVTQNYPNPDAEAIAIEKIYVHPGFDMTNFEGPDIALIKLASPSTKLPISLPGTGDQPLYNTNTACKVLGWGSIDNIGNPSDTLKVADVYIINYDTCKSNYSNSTFPWVLENYHVCAGYLKDSTAAGAGAGDSGGPLFVKKNNEWIHIGIVSGGDGTITTDEFPGVFTRTIEFIDWIDSVMAADAVTSVSNTEPERFNIFMNGNDLEISAAGQYSGKILISVHNLLGQTIVSDEITGSGTKISLAGLSSGIYIVNVRTAEGIESRKIYK